MQDRFKFRVWVKDSEEYIQDEAGECHIMHNGELICGDWVDDGYCGHYDYFNDDEVIVESCTGLRDKNGKLIYDGDILNSLYRNDGCRGLYVVAWGDGSLYVKKYGNHQQTFVSISLNNLTSCEVIGNIHENADLLENKDE